jgi:lysophospholipase L1-like esterase
MQMKKFVCVLFALTVAQKFYGSSCEFVVDDISYFKQQLGDIVIDKATADTIWISNRSPVSIRNINSDYMYTLINNNTVNYLRFSALNEAVYDGNSIRVKHISWAFPEVIMKGKYLLKAYKNNRKPQYEKTLNTIGDSITWACFGRYLRCLLRDEGLEYDFIGSHTDTFGFGHDAEGGNTSTQVLQRIERISSADNYFLLIGTNDWIENLTPLQTVNNIKKIAQLLYEKNNRRVFISTLLPTTSKNNARNMQINDLLLQSDPVCKNCIVIDVGGEFVNLTNYENLFVDGIHPTLEGYKKLSKIIARFINT